MSGSGRVPGWSQLLALAALVASTATATPVAARELRWSALVVDATLESDGTLAISERQDMVFTGDWNGGERTFRRFPGQRLTVERIVRIDPATGAEHELVRGDLDAVDHWDWAGSNAVRWRSRLPEDPPFNATPISYRLEYRLTGALQVAGERKYRLDHDWAFADREGVIERVEVRLHLGEGWSALSAHSEVWRTESLPPGEGFVVALDLESTGELLPAQAAPHRLPAAVSWVALSLLVSGVAFFLGGFLRRERALGRFGAPPAPAIDRAWLEEQLFTMPPEVVGAAWDRSVGSAEVAAVLARLTAEGKLAAEVRTSKTWIFARHDLHLRLLVHRGSLTDYERALVDALFGDAETTDTQSVRERYKSTGFDPAATIRAGVEARLKRSRVFASGSPKPDWRPTALLLAGGGALLLGALVFARGARALALAPLLFLVLPWLVLGLVPALVGQGRIRRLAAPFGLILGGVAFQAGALWLFAGWPDATLAHVGGALLLALGLTRATCNLLATRESAASLARRRELVSARDWFERELASPRPELEDRWYPYLLAFGLAPQVDRWFHRFGGASSGGAFGSTTPGTGGGSSGGGWTGGGGSFGGAGASASFAAAATAMSAGVSAPGSSSGGGGGGGSSGGGGGGGW